MKGEDHEVLEAKQMDEVEEVLTTEHKKKLAELTEKTPKKRTTRSKKSGA